MTKKAQENFLKMTARIALRSGCRRAKNGAVIVKGSRILVKTYNRVLPENDFCQRKGCLRDKLKLGLGKEAEKCRSIHAEARAISLAAQKGISLQRAVAYLTSQPCINCAKLLYSVGIKKVYFFSFHADKTGKVFLEKMGVSCQRVKLPGDDPSKRLRDISLQK